MNLTNFRYSMINFSKISNQSFFGKLLRKFLAIIPSGMTVKILQGKLKGKKWIKESGVNGYWLGSYESDQVKIFEKEIKEGDVVFDIGANAGFYSLLAAEIAGLSGKVFAFEPLPENFKYLKKHIEINGYKNIFPFEVAVSDKSGSAFFCGLVNGSEGHLMENGEIKVKTIAIDDWIEKGNLPIPRILKIDVEGAELSVLRGADSLLKENKPIIFLSTHNEDVHNKCCDHLLSLGYSLEPIGAEDINEANEILAYS